MNRENAGEIEPGAKTAEQSLVGQAVGQYRIIREIGKGGMGVVYLAADTRLGGHVALKFLPAKFVNDETRLRRFKQEARAARAVNHPNIVSIYDIAQEGDYHYIATEFIDGDNLRERMKRARMSIPEVITIACEIAAALEAAHARGIVHRDIKPGNVMIHPAGYVKLLDFGLAKLLKNSDREPMGPEISTVTDMNTGSWSRLGTPQYMSPEQLLGEELDGRTDIWSLGVMMYEMLAGTRPFEHRASDRDSPSSPEAALDFSPELQRIVMKALRKDKGERYQTARQILEDLKLLQRSMDSGVSTPNSTPVTTDGVGGRHVGAIEGSSGVEAATAPSSPTIVGSTHGSLSFRIAAVAFIVLSVVFLIRQYRWWFQPDSGKEAKTLFSRLLNASASFTPLTKPGKYERAAVSADGKYIATIVVSDNGKQKIQVEVVEPPSETTELVPPESSRLRGLSFDPNGDYVYYLKLGQDNRWNLFRVSILRRTVELITQGVNSAVSFSRSGKQMAFVRKKGEGTTALVIADVNGTNEREVAVLGPGSKDQFIIKNDIDNSPAWLPGEKAIACPASPRDSEEEANVFEVAVDTGSMRKINLKPWHLIGQIVALPDGSGFLLNAHGKEAPDFQLWLLAYESGEAARLSPGIIPRGLSLTNDCQTLVITTVTDASTIYLIQAGTTKSARERLSSASKGTVGISWSPDGKLFYTRVTDGNTDIWSAALGGSSERRLTDVEADDLEPFVSPDGRRVAFTSTRNGGKNVWIMDSNGSGQTQLTYGKEDDCPQITPDGMWIIYHGQENSIDRIFKIPAVGGEPALLTDSPAKMPAVSSDGRRIAFYSKPNPSTNVWKIGVMPFAGGRIEHVGAAPHNTDLGISWRPNPSQLTYVDTIDGASNIWSQSLPGGSRRPLTRFGKGDRISNFGWSPDGKQIACVRHEERKSLVKVKIPLP